MLFETCKRMQYIHESGLNGVNLSGEVYVSRRSCGRDEGVMSRGPSVDGGEATNTESRFAERLGRERAQDVPAG